MPLFQLLDKPGIVFDTFTTNSLFIDDRKIMVELPDNNIGFHVDNGTSNRVIPFLGFKQGLPIFGMVVDTDAPNYAFVKAYTTGPFGGEIIDEELWHHFLASLDTYIDFHSVTVSDHGTWNLNIISPDQTKCLYLVTDRFSDTSSDCVLSIQQTGAAQNTLSLYSIRYNTSSVNELQVVKENLSYRIDNVDTRLGQIEGRVSSTFISR